MKVCPHTTPHQRPTRLRGRRGTLPLRLWLVLAVAAIIGAGFLAQMGLTAVMTIWDQHAESARLVTVRQILDSSAAAWQSPAWERHTTSSLDALGVDVALYSSPPGAAGQILSRSPVYATPGARGYLGAGAQVGGTRGPVFQRLVITSGAASRATGVALLWLNEPPPGELPQELWPVIELGTFAFTLAIVVWLVGLPVLRPLAELSRAAEGMAGGDLNVRLRAASPVREIAEVSSALVETGAALQRSLAEQTALEEDRRLFFAAVAHDLRTPLFMLRGYLRGLQLGVATTPEKVTQYVVACSTQAEALERRIADLFAFTCVEYLDREPQREPLELGSLLRETVAAARPPAATKFIALDLNGPATPCNVLGDQRLLVRAVESLLDNAVRHTPEGGRIVVRWRERAGKAEFEIEDTGPGITAHDLPHLFTPLYRGEDSRNRKTGGAGLGLTIARRILRVHGGDLMASNAPAGGARFTATLPAETKSASTLDSRPLASALR
jgi:signal transduction histidine kinase